MESGGVHLHAVCQPDSSTQEDAANGKPAYQPAYIRYAQAIMKEERLYVLEP